MAAKPSFPIVHVLWRDANGWSGWHESSEVERFGIATVSTVGALVYDDDKVVKLAGSVAWGNAHFGDLTVIPRGWIKSMKRIGKVEEW